MTLSFFLATLVISIPLCIVYVKPPFQLKYLALLGSSQFVLSSAPHKSSIEHV